MGKKGHQTVEAVRPFIFSAPIFATLVGIYYWNVECLPSFPGLVLFCRSGPTLFGIYKWDPYLQQLTKLLVVTTSTWLVNWIISNSLWEFHFSVSHPHCYSNYIRLFRKCVLQANDTASPNKLLRMYQEIRLIVGMHNCIQSNMMVNMMFVNTLVLTVCLYIILSSLQTISLPQLMFLVIALLDRLIINKEMVGRMGEVNFESVSLLRALKGLHHLKVCGWTRRYVRSFPEIKIKLGAINYFDSLSALANIDLVCTQTASLLLL